MKEEIQNWLDNDQDPFSGINLLEKYCPDKIFVRLMKINPHKNKSKIVSKLAEIANLNYSERKSKAKGGQTRKGKSFREEFPFLSSPTCPIELKALITDNFLLTMHIEIFTKNFLTAPRQMNAPILQQSCSITTMKTG